MNHYEILEVSPKASATVIRAAYKSLMQRYHPDKNPGAADTAELASLVVQAYEVLSDSAKRSAYDLALSEAAQRSRPHDYDKRRRGRAPATHSAKSAAQDSRYFWFMCLIIVVIVLSGWTMISLLKAKPSPDAAQRGASLVHAEIPAKGVLERVRSSDSGRVLVLASRLEVRLKKPEQSSEDPGRMLFIPELAVKVGLRDAEYAIRHLDNTADLIRQKLQENLAGAEFDALINPDGQRYLARLILNAIGEATGTAPSLTRSSADPESPERYGVVEVLLPESFSVR